MVFHMMRMVNDEVQLLHFQYHDRRDSFTYVTFIKKELICVPINNLFSDPFNSEESFFN